MDHVYNLLSSYAAATRERLFSSLLDRFLSVLNRILPSQIDSIVNQFRSIIVRNVYNFCTIYSVPVAYQIKALIIIYPTVLLDLMVYFFNQMYTTFSESVQIIFICAHQTSQEIDSSL